MSYKDNNNSTIYLVEELNKKGYDVIIVNFPSNKIEKNWLPNLNKLPLDRRYVDGGADYIERNGKTVATLIKNINAQLRTNGSSEKLVIVGPSMGGLISRYALAYLEKLNINHNTKLWVSFDSPHLGANIPLGLQTSLYLMKEYNIPGSADFYDYELKSPAAQQMLIHQHTAELTSNHLKGRITEQGFSSNQGSPLYQNFYKNLQNNGLPGSNGYPTAYGITNVALLNGSPNINSYGTNGENTVNIDGFGNLCLVFCTHPLVLEFETYNLNSVNRSRLSRFRIGFNSTTISQQLTDERGNMDLIGGGYTNSYETIVNTFLGRASLKESVNWLTLHPIYLIFGNIAGLKNPYFNVQKNTKIHNFIPAISALGFKNANFNWNTPITNSLIRNRVIPFSYYYIPSHNQRHVFLTQESVLWFFDQLNGNYWNNTGEIKITGPTTICNQATYTINNLPPEVTIQWSVHPSLSIVSRTNNSIVVSCGIYPEKILTDVWIRAQTSDGFINKSINNIVIWKPGITQTEDLIIGWLNEHGGEVQVAESIRDLGRNFQWSSSVNNWEPTMQGYYFTQFFENGDLPGGDGVYVTVEFDDPCGRRIYLYRQFNIDWQYPFSLYPNPATDQVTLNLPAETPQNSSTLSATGVNKTIPSGVTQIQLWSGAALLKSFQTTELSYQISVEDLPKGIYFVVVIKGGKQYSQKLIKK